MSRYGFNVDDVEIVVGWDNPIQTFFGTTETGGKVVVDTMIGMGQFDVKSLRLLVSMIGFKIPPEIGVKLIEDRDGPTPTPLQARMNDIFKPMLEDE